MAADAYLKSAASYLKQAAAQLRDEARRLNSEYMRSRHDRETTINKNSLEIKARQAEATMANDDSQKSHAITAAKNMQQQSEQAKREIQQIDANAQNITRAKNAMSDNLERQAHQLESQAGSRTLQ